jgi:ribose 5-phosphate isomerase B
MRIALGSDHRGFRLKEKLGTWLREHGHTVLDLGTDGPDSTDYPDYAFAVARAVARRRASRGILICGTGIGMSIAANRLRGVRAALCGNANLARQSRRHNNANVLCLGADIISPTRARQVVDTWLRTDFEGGRHRRRVRKLDCP